MAGFGGTLGSAGTGSLWDQMLRGSSSSSGSALAGNDFNKVLGQLGIKKTGVGPNYQAGGYSPQEFIYGSGPSAALRMEDDIRRTQGLKDQWKSDEELKQTILPILLKQMMDGKTSQEDFQRELAKMGISGGIGLLGSIVGKGYIDADQAKTAQGRFSDVLGNASALRGDLQGIAKNGSFTPEEIAKFNKSYGGAYDTAATQAESGGYSDAEWADFMGKLNRPYDKLSSIADNGYLSKQEFENVLASSQREVEDQHRAAAEQTFNQSLGGSTSPVAAAAIMTKGASEAGKAKANKYGELTDKQAQSRMSAAEALTPLVNILSQAQGSRASNRVSAGKTLADLPGVLSSFLGKNADGRMDANRALASLLGIEGDVAGKMSNIDLQTMPKYIQDLYSRLQGNGMIDFVSGGKTGGRQLPAYQKTPAKDRFTTLWRR